MNHRQSGRFLSLVCAVFLLVLGLALYALVPGSAAAPLRANTLTVTNTDDSGPGSLRRAIADAGPGDTINFTLSYPATITLTSGELVVAKPLTIAGPGPDLLIISGNEAGRVFSVDLADGTDHIAVTLFGLTIRDGLVAGGEGGGIWNDETLTLSNVVLMGNEARSGGGLYNARDSSALLSGVAFRGNWAAGVHPFETPGGGGMYNAYGSHVVLINVVMYGNWADEAGGGLYNYYCDATLTNVTLGYNRAGLVGGGIYNLESNAAFQNSILWDNVSSWQGDQISNASDSLTIAHSDVEGSGGSGAGWDGSLGTDLGGNLDVDPGFVRPADSAAGPAVDGDPRLQWGSPVRDAGDNALLPPGVDTDLAGDPRIAYDVVDMGAYELQPGLYLSKTADRDGAATGQRVVYTITALNTFPDQVLTGGLISDTLPAELILVGPILLDPPGAGVVGTSPPFLVHDLTLQPGQAVTLTFPVRVRTTTPLGTISNRAAMTCDQVPVPQVAVHHLGVCAAGSTVTSDADDGTGSLRQAIDRTCPTGRIDFALSLPATITLASGELRISKALTIAGPGPDLLALSGGEAGRILRIDKAGGVGQIDVRLSGLSIRDGLASRGGGIWNDESLILDAVALRGNQAPGCFPLGQGAALYNDRASPVLTDVVFVDNAGGSGAGLYNFRGAPVLAGVHFRENGVSGDNYCGGGVGAAIFNYSGHLVLQDSTLEDNRASAGGGIYGYRDSTAILTNVALRGNWAGNGGGMYNNGGRVVLTNVILSGNRAGDHGGGLLNYGVSVTLTNVSLVGNWAYERGGGIYSYSDDSTLAVRNSIVWNNRAGTAGDQIDGYQKPPAILHSDVEGSGGSGEAWNGSAGLDLGGNLDVDPRFVLPPDPDDAPTTAGDLHLLWDSPALDGGDNHVDPDPGSSPPDSLYDVATDLDGAPRITCGTVDIGAYEAQRYLCLDKAASADQATPGQRITYTLAVWNESAATTMTGGRVSDQAPVGMILAGPVALDPPGAGAVGASLPVLATDLTLQPGQQVTVTFPLTVTENVPVHTVVNVASVSSSQVPTPSLAYHDLLVCLSDPTVTLDADGGPGSLPQAVIQACPGSTIDFDLTYPATITLAGEEMLIAKPLTIVGPGADLLAISGNRASPVWRVDRPGGAGQIAVAISGLTIRDGYADYDSVQDGYGGGLWNDEHLTLIDVAFRHNQAQEDGGGMYSENSDPMLRGVSFYDNFAGYQGGGLYSIRGGPTLMNVAFRHNSAETGGGMVNSDGSATLTNVTFTDNVATYGWGGGLRNVDAEATLTNVLLAGNTADDEGGGISNIRGVLTLTNVTLYDNHADYGGDGVSNRDSSAAIYNSILWGSASQIVNTGSSTPTFICSDVQGSGGSGPGWDPGLGIDGGGNLDADPLFLAPAAGNLRLSWTSPAVNAGDNGLLADGVGYDLDGRRRIAFGRVDMGAYEALPPGCLYLPLIRK